MKLNIVIVCYYLNPYKIEKLIESFLDNYTYNLIIVNNNPKFSNISSKFRIIQGSNELLDFSGYVEGLKYLGYSGRESIIFINDTLFIKHPYKLILKELLFSYGYIYKLSIPIIVGKSDSYSTFYIKNPISGISKYISTFCFMLNSKGIDIFICIYNKITNNISILDRDIFNNFITLHFYEKNFSLNIAANTIIMNQLELDKKKKTIEIEHSLTGLISLQGAIIPINAKLKIGILIFLFRVYKSLLNKVYKRRIQGNRPLEAKV